MTETTVPDSSLVNPYKTKTLSLNSTLEIGDNKTVLMMAGPCSVESYEQTLEVAEAVYESGVKILRGGAYKPRTSPYSFNGLGIEGLKILRSVADEFGLLVVTEALSVENIPDVAEYGDIIQIGSRNMQHYPLLWAAGEMDKPVLLKRGYMATIDEWIMAAEHIASRGNEKIILCERGIRSFDSATRNILDIAAIDYVKKRTEFPVIADPSHATGKADMVLPVAKAAVAAGADGIIVEFHPNPIDAKSDPEQALPSATIGQFKKELGNLALGIDKIVI